MLRQRSKGSDTHLKVSIYDGQGLKDELSKFLAEAIEHGVLYCDPLTPFKKLPRFANRDLFESYATAKRNALLNPDIKLGGVHGYFVAEQATRQYKVWILNPVFDSAFKDWYGPSVLLGVQGMSNLIQCIEKSTKQITTARSKVK